MSKGSGVCSHLHSALFLGRYHAVAGRGGSADGIACPWRARLRGVGGLAKSEEGVSMERRKLTRNSFVWRSVDVVREGEPVDVIVLAVLRE